MEISSVGGCHPQAYEEEDIFNTDEAGMFYKMTADQALKFKGDKCTNGKLPKVKNNCSYMCKYEQLGKLKINCRR